MYIDKEQISNVITVNKIDITERAAKLGRSLTTYGA